MRHSLLVPAIITAIGFSACTTVSADTLGFRVGGYSWGQDYDGDIRSSASVIDEVDLNNDLGLDDENGTSFFVEFEHPIPVIPNIRLEQTELEISATGNPSRNFTFDGQTFVVTDEITTNSDLSHIDGTLYYEILDNWISIDIGLTVRQFDEGVTLTSNTDNAELEIDSAIPMLYLAAKAELPLSGLYVSAKVNGLGTGDASLIDYKAAIGYETSVGFGIEAGLRSFELDYDDDEDQANLTIDGIFAGVFYHF
jgi:outer membrane protein